MGKIMVRKISTDDLPALKIIAAKTFVETYGSVNTAENMQLYLDNQFSASVLQMELEDKNTVWYFAEDHGIPVGYLKLNLGVAQTDVKDNTSLEIERIYVLNAYQGKAIGQKLFEQSVQLARELGLNYIWLGVWDQNQKALHFYRKNGFEEFGNHIFKLGEDEQNDILLKKILV